MKLLGSNVTSFDNYHNIIVIKDLFHHNENLGQWIYNVFWFDLREFMMSLKLIFYVLLYILISY